VACLKRQLCGELQLENKAIRVGDSCVESIVSSASAPEVDHPGHSEPAPTKFGDSRHHVGTIVCFGKLYRKSHPVLGLREEVVQIGLPRLPLRRKGARERGLRLVGILQTHKPWGFPNRHFLECSDDILHDHGQAHGNLSGLVDRRLEGLPVIRRQGCKLPSLGFTRVEVLSGYLGHWLTAEWIFNPTGLAIISAGWRISYGGGICGGRGRRRGLRVQ
jgi:hypothetical protein